MPSWRVTTWLLIGWTLAMAAWFVMYRETTATCGPEIYRNCQIGLKVDAGMGRPGIVVLWALGAVALGLTWLTTSGAGGARSEKPAKRPLPVPLLAAAKLSAVVIPVAVVVGFAASPTLRDSRAPSRDADVGVSVLSTVLRPAATPAGRRKHAARVSVRLRVANRGSRRLNLERTVLRSGDGTLAYDRAQSDAAGSLLRPVDPGASADGTLRFEPRSAFTERLVRGRRARLDIAGQTVSLTVKIGRPVMPKSAVP